jgi:hypothetical protein
MMHWTGHGLSFWTLTQADRYRSTVSAAAVEVCAACSRCLLNFAGLVGSAGSFKQQHSCTGQGEGTIGRTSDRTLPAVCDL